MPITFTPDTTYHGVASSHNIVINEDSGFAYAVGNGSGGETCGGQLHIIDIRDPKNPTFAGCFNHQQGGTHDSQCVIYHGRDADYAGREVCFSSNGSSFVIADVTRKDSTTLIAASTYPNVAYTHQGWLTEDHNHFYMNDELDEMNGLTDQTRTLIWDLSDLDDPQLAKEYYLNSGASDHNLYIRGDYLYESNYQAGLRILDISDRLNPVEVGNFDTAPYAEDEAGFGGSWSNYPYFRSGVIAVSSRNEGLFILRYRQVDS
jgi:choice-of-anchor B domain-containing protein